MENWTKGILTDEEFNIINKFINNYFHKEIQDNQIVYKMLFLAILDSKENNTNYKKLYYCIKNTLNKNESINEIIKNKNFYSMIIYSKKSHCPICKDSETINLLETFPSECLSAIEIMSEYDTRGRKCSNCGYKW